MLGLLVGWYMASIPRFYELIPFLFPYSHYNQKASTSYSPKESWGLPFCFFFVLFICPFCIGFYVATQNSKAKKEALLPPFSFVKKICEIRSEHNFFPPELLKVWLLTKMRVFGVMERSYTTQHFTFLLLWDSWNGDFSRPTDATYAHLLPAIYWPNTLNHLCLARFSCS